SDLVDGDDELSKADAIFFSKDNGNDAFGESFAGLGDINGDGFGDFAISAPRTNGSKGVVYIYYGGLRFPFSSKVSGVRSWSASIEGETGFYYLGLHSLSGIGDVNGDLLNDIAIGEYWSTNKRGKVYVIYGKSETVLTGNIAVSTASDLIISGETDSIQVGYTVSSGGEINEDGVSEFLVGVNKLDSSKGGAYVFQGFKNVTPNSVSAIKLYSDSSFSTESPLGQFSNRDMVYVEALATDQKSTSRNIMEVMVSSNSVSRGTLVRLRETSVNSGTFRGHFKLVRSRSSFLAEQISADLSDTVTITPKFDSGSPNKTLTIINAVPKIDDISVQQVGTNNSTEMRISYLATDYDNNAINFNQDSFDVDASKGNQVQYSSDGLTWANAKIIGTLSNSNASENGTAHSTSFQGLVWDVVNDVGVTDNMFQIRMKPHDSVEYGDYSVSSQFHVDNVAPNAPVLSSIPFTYAEEITVTGSAEANTTVFVYVDNSFEASANVSNDGLFSVFPVTVTQDALVTAILEDAIGYRSVTSNVVTANFSSSIKVFNIGELGVTLSIPLNAVTNNRAVSFASVSTSSIGIAAPSTFTYVEAFSLAIDDGVDRTTFSDPVTVTLKMSVEMPVNSGVSVNYYDTSTSSWKSDGITLVNVGLDSLQFTTNHFTLFAVFQLRDPYPPVITNIKLDGVLAVDNSYIDVTPTISAEIQDGDSGISTWSITIQKQSSSTPVDSKEVGGLSSTSNMLISFNSVTSLTDDAYQAVISATDANGNITAKTLLFNVNSAALFFDILHAPNPFNPDSQTMKFGYSISQPVDSFDIHILSLRRDTVWRYRGGDVEKQAGYHTLSWDGKRDDGTDLPNGVYYGYCIVKSGSTTEKKRLKIAILR
ncbi:hypothetical protein DID80_03970, partial [Candidatus Marinamargulisbacteria bacterium SCGC AAA071-K20]